MKHTRLCNSVKTTPIPATIKLSTQKRFSIGSSLITNIIGHMLTFDFLQIEIPSVLIVKVKL